MVKVLRSLSLLIGVAVCLVGFVACASQEPVATKYKKQNPNGFTGDGGGDTTTGTGQTGQTGTGGTGTGTGDATGGEANLVQQGQELWTSKTCEGCHAGATKAGLTGEDLAEAQSNPVHGGVSAWPAQADLDAMAAYLATL